jgi:branched-subunit amino acid aminotransferase/4-amino-4-deoxychorismate lyase
VRVEIDGRAASAGEALSVTSSFGHFTAMQVRGGRTRGLALHLARLEAANRELFDVSLDHDHVRALIRQALGETADASVRVYGYETDAEPAIVVTVREPAEVQTPMRLRSVRYQRPDGHLKHLATGQGYYSRLARRSGFDDALLTADDGAISESATANIGFFDDEGVVWPDAPLLHGTTMQLLELTLPGSGVPSRRAPVHLRDIPAFEGAFLTSARGVAAVSRVDDTQLAERCDRMKTLEDAYASVPWEPI